MSTSTEKIVEGVFAINKPPSISSAQVIRNVQHHFNASNLFAPWLQAERAYRQEEARRTRSRRKDKRIQVKIGHGGTLDPMATGVLILGIGKGTKRLQSFLECTKTYEATILFGAATDTYDILGKVLKRAPCAHLTREQVEKSLSKFRGKIMQRPPIFSALRMDGKRLYEYAREGEQIPREIEKRPVEVQELELLEWLDGASHSYRLPDKEAEDEVKDVADKVLYLNENNTASTTTDSSRSANGVKRKRSTEDEEDDVVTNKKPALEHEEPAPETLMSGGLQSPGRQPVEDPVSRHPSPGSDVPQAKISNAPEESPPAVKLRMTVTSGFYVRSLSHDLGEAVGSLACMSELVRTRQGDFQLGENVLEYEELEEGEDIWGPKVEKLLSDSES